MTLVEVILIALLGTLFGFNLCKFVHSFESSDKQGDDGHDQRSQ